MRIPDGIDAVLGERANCAVAVSQYQHTVRTVPRACQAHCLAVQSKERCGVRRERAIL